MSKKPLAYIDIKLDCLISKNTNRAYIINNKNRKRCQILWQNRKNKYFRGIISNIEDAEKYNKKNDFITKAEKYHNGILATSKANLIVILNERDACTYGDFSSDIDEENFQITRAKKNLEYLQQQKKRG